MRSSVMPSIFLAISPASSGGFTIFTPPPLLVARVYLRFHHHADANFFAAASASFHVYELPAAHRHAVFRQDRLPRLLVNFHSFVAALANLAAPRPPASVARTD